MIALTEINKNLAIGGAGIGAGIAATTLLTKKNKPIDKTKTTEEQLDGNKKISTQDSESDTKEKLSTAKTNLSKLKKEKKDYNDDISQSKIKVKKLDKLRQAELNVDEDSKETFMSKITPMYKRYLDEGEHIVWNFIQEGIEKQPVETKLTKEVTTSEQPNLINKIGKTITDKVKDLSDEHPVASLAGAGASAIAAGLGAKALVNKLRKRN